MMAAEMLWVVETGMPRWVAARMTVAELVSAAKPLIGWSFTILWPRVLIMRQPPTAVPAHMVSAQTTLIQRAMPSLAGSMGVRRKASQAGAWSKWPALVAAKRVRAMMPMVFWASLVPCMKPIAPALNIWARQKKRLTRNGRALRSRT